MLSLFKLSMSKDRAAVLRNWTLGITAVLVVLYITGRALYLTGTLGRLFG